MRVCAVRAATTGTLRDRPSVVFFCSGVHVNYRDISVRKSFLADQLHFAALPVFVSDCELLGDACLYQVRII